MVVAVPRGAIWATTMAEAMNFWLCPSRHIRTGLFQPLFESLIAIQIPQESSGSPAVTVSVALSFQESIDYRRTKSLRQGELARAFSAGSKQQQGEAVVESA